jgi:hypothetical protein
MGTTSWVTRGPHDSPIRSLFIRVKREVHGSVVSSWMKREEADVSAFS